MAAEKMVEAAGNFVVDGVKTLASNATTSPGGVLQACDTYLGWCVGSLVAVAAVGVGVTALAACCLWRRQKNKAAVDTQDYRPLHTSGKLAEDAAARDAAAEAGGETRLVM